MLTFPEISEDLTSSVRGIRKQSNSCYYPVLVIFVNFLHKLELELELETWYMLELYKKR